jgi:hypothetical protein
MTVLKSLLIIALFTLTNCAVSNSQNSSWTLLGEKTATYSPDRDVLLVNAVPTYNTIKVRIASGKVLMQDMRVEFGDGEVMDVPLRYVFGKGGYSRDIPLPRGNRHITRVTFLYQTASTSWGRALVQVWAL